jgi:hypothetical protein
VGEIRLQGIPASEGIAIGPAFLVLPEPLGFPARPESPNRRLPGLRPQPRLPARV